MPFLPKSTSRICVALGLKEATALREAAHREYKDGNTLLEFRLDYLPAPERGVELIRTLTQQYSDLRILATCRAHANRGGFTGTVEQQSKILHDAARAGAFAVDLEIESAAVAKEAAAKLREQASLIISYHNYESTPALDPLLRKLEKIPADAYKIATTARKSSDSLRLLQWSREHSAKMPLITLAMEEAGTVTRVLSLAAGSLFTYAAPLEGSGTAPGQISACAMRTLFRPAKLSRNSRIYGVIADPVAHSKSPLIQNRAFQARRFDAVYLPFRVAAGQLGDWMKLATDLPIAGFSVTIPHKTGILRYLDIVEPMAKRIGAVNTVWRKGGKWRGTNTDGMGVVGPLSKQVRLAHASVLIAGYGGGARAAAFALLDAGADITVTGRNLRGAQALAQAIKGRAITLAEANRKHFDALVHATPIGMSPNVNKSLFNERIPANVLFDMVYNPRETSLIKRAKEQGCSIVYGEEMLVEQAARQFEIWTGEAAPRTVMANALAQ